MDKIGCGKWNIWIVVLLLGTTLSAVVTTQPVGFLSIDCGGKANHTDENNITWVTDANYIDIGQTGKTGDAIQLGSGSYSQNLRFFPKPLNKSCYQLPVTPDVPHLLRLWFAVGSAFELFPSFSYSIETLGMLYTKNITPTQRYTPDNFEGILVSSGTLLCICLIRTSETDDPFINAIELRTLRDGMYAEAKPGTMLILRDRLNCGGHSTVRYPQDNFDRLWLPDDETRHHVRPISTEEPILTNNTEDLPPMMVMQTAWVLEDFYSSSTQGSKSWERTKQLQMLYFAEIEMLNMSESRSFYIMTNKERWFENINLTLYSAVERRFLLNNVYIFEIVKAKNSTRLPIVNAAELFYFVDTEPARHSQDSKGDSNQEISSPSTPLRPYGPCSPFCTLISVCRLSRNKE